MALNNQDKTSGKQKMTKSERSERGFAAMDPYSRLHAGSNADHTPGKTTNAHEFVSDEADTLARKSHAVRVNK